MVKKVRGVDGLEGSLWRVVWTYVNIFITFFCLFTLCVKELPYPPRVHPLLCLQTKHYFVHEFSGNPTCEPFDTVSLLEIRIYFPSILICWTHFKRNGSMECLDNVLLIVCSGRNGLLNSILNALESIRVWNRWWWVCILFVLRVFLYALWFWCWGVIVVFAEASIASQVLSNLFHKHKA